MRGGLPWPTWRSREPGDTQTNGETDSWVGRDGGIATDRDRQREKQRCGEPNQLEKRLGQRDGGEQHHGNSESRVLQREPEMDERKQEQVEWGEADAERLRRTNDFYSLNFLLGLLGPLRHLGKSCRAP